jgi:hypothetical protein
LETTIGVAVRVRLKAELAALRIVSSFSRIIGTFLLGFQSFSV